MWKKLESGIGQIPPSTPRHKRGFVKSDDGDTARQEVQAPESLNKIEVAVAGEGAQWEGFIQQSTGWKADCHMLDIVQSLTGLSDLISHCWQSPRGRVQHSLPCHPETSMSYLGSEVG